MSTAVVSTSTGFVVYADETDWSSCLKTFSYGAGQEAFELAREVDEIVAALAPFVGEATQ